MEYMYEILKLFFKGVQFLINSSRYPIIMFTFLTHVLEFTYTIEKFSGIVIIRVSALIVSGGFAYGRGISDC